MGIISAILVWTTFIGHKTRDAWWKTMEVIGAIGPIFPTIESGPTSPFAPVTQPPPDIGFPTYITASVPRSTTTLPDTCTFDEYFQDAAFRNSNDSEMHSAAPVEPSRDSRSMALLSIVLVIVAPALYAAYCHRRTLSCFLLVRLQPLRQAIADSIRSAEVNVVRVSVVQTPPSNIGPLAETVLSYVEQGLLDPSKGSLPEQLKMAREEREWVMEKEATLRRQYDEDMKMAQFIENTAQQEQAASRAQIQRMERHLESAKAHRAKSADAAGKRSRWLRKEIKKNEGLCSKVLELSKQNVKLSMNQNRSKRTRGAPPCHLNRFLSRKKKERWYITLSSRSNTIPVQDVQQGELKTEKPQKDVEDLRAENGELKQTNEKARKDISELEETLSAMSNEQAEVHEQQQMEIEILQKEVKQLKGNGDTISDLQKEVSEAKKETASLRQQLIDAQDGAEKARKAHENNMNCVKREWKKLVEEKTQAVVDFRREEGEKQQAVDEKSNLTSELEIVKQELLAANQELAARVEQSQGDLMTPSPSAVDESRPLSLGSGHAQGLDAPPTASMPASSSRDAVPPPFEPSTAPEVSAWPVLAPVDTSSEMSHTPLEVKEGSPPHYHLTAQGYSTESHEAEPMIMDYDSRLSEALTGNFSGLVNGQVQLDGLSQPQNQLGASGYDDMDTGEPEGTGLHDQVQKNDQDMMDSHEFTQTSDVPSAQPSNFAQDPSSYLGESQAQSDFSNAAYPAGNGQTELQTSGLCSGPSIFSHGGQAGSQAPSNFSNPFLPVGDGHTGLQALSTFSTATFSASAWQGDFSFGLAPSSSGTTSSTHRTSGRQRIRSGARTGEDTVLTFDMVLGKAPFVTCTNCDKSKGMSDDPCTCPPDHHLPPGNKSENTTQQDSNRSAGSQLVQTGHRAPDAPPKTSKGKGFRDCWRCSKPKDGSKAGSQCRLVDFQDEDKPSDGDEDDGDDNGVGSHGGQGGVRAAARTTTTPAQRFSSLQPSRLQSGGPGNGNEYNMDRGQPSQHTVDGGRAALSEHAPQPTMNQTASTTSQTAAGQTFCVKCESWTNTPSSVYPEWCVNCYLGSMVDLAERQTALSMALGDAQQDVNHLDDEAQVEGEKIKCRCPNCEAQCDWESMTASGMCTDCKKKREGRKEICDGCGGDNDEPTNHPDYCPRCWDDFSTQAEAESGYVCAPSHTSANAAVQAKVLNTSLAKRLDLVSAKESSSGLAPQQQTSLPVKDNDSIENDRIDQGQAKVLLEFESDDDEGMKREDVAMPGLNMTNAQEHDESDSELSDYVEYEEEEGDDAINGQPQTVQGVGNNTADANDGRLFGCRNDNCRKPCTWEDMERGMCPACELNCRKCEKRCPKLFDMVCAKCAAEEAGKRQADRQDDEDSDNEDDGDMFGAYKNHQQKISRGGGKQQSPGQSSQKQPSQKQPSQKQQLRNKRCASAERSNQDSKSPLKDQSMSNARFDGWGAPPVGKCPVCGQENELVQGKCAEWLLCLGN